MRCFERSEGGGDRTERRRGQAFTSGGVALAAVVALCTSACGPGEGTARGVAERFLDAHYVRIDLPAARAYTGGLARQKIDEEVRLTEGQVVDSSTRVPRVHYSLAQERVHGEDVVSFEYDATIHPEDAASFHRMLQLTLRRGADGWKVTNYHEFASPSE